LKSFLQIVAEWGRKGSTDFRVVEVVTLSAHFRISATGLREVLFYAFNAPVLARADLRGKPPGAHCEMLRELISDSLL
jgi:hypothetical protein